MKKSLFFVAGLVMLASCSADPNEEAATAFCACYETNFDEMDIEQIEADLAAMENGTWDAEAEMAKEEKCLNDWKAKYNIGKDNIDFRVALKNMSPSMYRKAVKLDICE